MYQQKESVFNKILPDVHPLNIQEVSEACEELHSGLTSSILRDIDTSLPTVVLVGGEEGYLISECMRETSLPFSSITVSPRNVAMRFYLPDYEKSHNASNGLVPDFLLTELGGDMRTITPESVAKNFRRASGINKNGKLLSAKSEFELTGIMSLLHEAYIHGRQMFDTDKFNLLYGGYGKLITSHEYPVSKINSLLRELSDDPSATHNLINIAMQSMDSSDRGSLTHGMNIINPFLGYSFYRSASSVGYQCRSLTIDGMNNLSILDALYVSMALKRGIKFDYIEDIIPASIGISNSLCVPENILYSARKLSLL